MGKVIFSYRVKNDTGFAPCIDHGLFTIACCKGGQIRNGKNVLTGVRYHVGKHWLQNPDDEIYILGIYKHKLLYYAKSTNVVSMTDYFSKEMKSQLGKRTDHIYNAKAGALHRNNHLPDIHPKGDPQNQKDANGVYVVISDLFSYYGMSAPLIPYNVLTVLPKFRENLTYHETDAAFKIISEYIDGVVLFDGVTGLPHKPLDIPKWRGF